MTCIVHVTTDLLKNLPVSKYRDYSDDAAVDSDATDDYWPSYHQKPPTRDEQQKVIPPLPKIKLPKRKLILSHLSKLFGFKVAFHCIQK